MQSAAKSLIAATPVLCGVLFGVLLWLWTYPRPQRTLVLLPAGTKGPFSIQSEHALGAEAKIQNGTLVLPIPESRVLRINGKSPFFEWHEIDSVTFLDKQGRSVPQAHPEHPLPDEMVAVRASIGTSAPLPPGADLGRTKPAYYENLFFIGTATEAAKWDHRVNADKKTR